MLSKKYNLLYVLVLSVITLSACQMRPIYEQTTIFPEHQWNSEDSLQYIFQIDDSTNPYKLFFVLRHHNAYHYKNIWVDFSTKSPSGERTNQSYNLLLADESKGWLGTGMGDIYDHRIGLTTSPIKLQKGLYTITLHQTMREDPLQGVLAAGVRVEKITR